MNIDNPYKSPESGASPSSPVIRRRPAHWLRAISVGGLLIFGFVATVRLAFTVWIFLFRNGVTDEGPNRFRSIAFNGQAFYFDSALDIFWMAASSGSFFVIWRGLGKGSRRMAWLGIGALIIALSGVVWRSYA